MGGRMAQDDLRRAIQQMQDGHVEEAAGWLRRLVEAPELDAKGRAAAYVWLAEASADRAYKRRCLERALACEPDNAQIRQGLNHLLAAPAQPEDLPRMTRDKPSTSKLDVSQPIVEIEGGRNGPASGILISRDGLLATTSYALGSATEVRVRLGDGREQSAKAGRRFPLFDVAFVLTDFAIARPPAVSPPATILANAACVAWGCGGFRLSGNLANDARGMASHWLETNILPAQLPDAGGNPLLDERGQLLGVLTRNLGANGCACALRMTKVMALAEQFRRDRQLMPKAVYCPSCGALARAPMFGGGACELCGARLGPGRGRSSWNEQLARLYGENAGPACQHCGARLGSRAGRCLRCGFGMEQSEAS